MPSNIRQYPCYVIDKDVIVTTGRGIKVYCPYYNRNIDRYSLKPNRVCSAEFPENHSCIVLEQMIKEMMKEKKSRLLSK